MGHVSKGIWANKDDSRCRTYLIHFIYHNTSVLKISDHKRSSEGDICEFSFFVFIVWSEARRIMGFVFFSRYTGSGSTEISTDISEAFSTIRNQSRKLPTKKAAQNKHTDLFCIS